MDEIKKLQRNIEEMNQKIKSIKNWNKNLLDHKHKDKFKIPMNLTLIWIFWVRRFRTSYLYVGGKYLFYYRELRG